VQLTGYIFKGQCYDTGAQAKRKCGLCAKDIRYCFILKNGDLTLVTGPCCFSRFGEPVRKQLEAAKTWLLNIVQQETYEKRTGAVRWEVKERRGLWRIYRRQAIEAIRKYRQETKKEWLPESLFELKIEAAKKPTFKTPSWWYKKQAEKLKARIDLISAPSTSGDSTCLGDYKGEYHGIQV